MIFRRRLLLGSGAAAPLDEKRLPEPPLGECLFVYTGERFKNIYVNDGAYIGRRYSNSLGCAAIFAPTSRSCWIPG
jgi:hypothetical protein